MAGKVEARLLKGFRDFLPAEQGGRNAMLERITRAFESCGFAPLSTPAIEYSDILLGKYGEEGDKLLYRFQDNGERDVALRYDLTVPLARVMAQYRELPKPFKRYQVGTVWRAEKPAHGRFREFMQCDADIVGTSSPLADADCMVAVVLALRSLDVTRFTVRVGHRAILNGLLDRAGIQPESHVAVLRLIDKMDKVGEEAVADMILGVVAMERADALALLRNLQSADLGPVAEALAGNEAASAGVAHLQAVLAAADAMGIGDNVRVDLSIARGLDYYTGTVYETTLTDLPGIGSVSSGGRYDGLLTMFGVPAIPAVGISIGVDRLYAALAELGCAPTGRSGAVAVVCPVGAVVLTAGLGLLADLRQAGIPSESVPDPAVRLGKQVEFAAKRGARFAIILGEAEVAAGIAAVKDLGKGTQVTVPLADVAGFVTRGGEAG